jgi:hypothetical protein
MGLAYPAVFVLPAAADCPTARGIKACRSLHGGELCINPKAASGSFKPPPIQQDFDERRAFSVSNVDGFDDALRQHVLPPLAELFGTRPTFLYYDDEAEGRPNALASNDGRILFGNKLLTDMLARDNGDYAVMAAIAHEYGHMLQFKKVDHEVLFGNLPCFCTELHADFLAGFFIRRFRSLFEGADIQAVGVAWDAWDKHSCTHGTREQRLAAIETGYSFGDPGRRRSIDDAFAQGAEYLLQYA